MVKKNNQGLSCEFKGPAEGQDTGTATVFRGKEAIAVSTDLKTSAGGFWDKAFGVKPGQDYIGTARNPNEPNATPEKMHVFIMNSESMGCTIESKSIVNAPAPREPVRAAPAASAPAGP